MTFSSEIEFPEKLEALFQPKRYKVLYGGRGGAKSWGVARALISIASIKPTRIGCFREIQKSIKESVHTLIKQQIESMKVLGWTVQENRIFHANGSEFVFSGLRTLNAENIKSFEGLDVAWVEEARNVSKASWDILIPTIRKEGSEIWVSFNPELDDDETYVRFVRRADDRMTLIEMGWNDNPWFPQVLDDERRVMQRNDPDGYLTVWEGKCRQFLDGAIYAAEIRKATENDRITRVPYEPLRPVHTFWDLGFSDATAIWLVQNVGMEHRVIDYIEGNAKALDWYVKELRKRDVIWGIDWLPHDARAKSFQTGMSAEQMLRSAGRDVRIVPQLSVADGIGAARTIFGKCWFDEEKTRAGVNRLRRYAYEIDDNGHRGKLPLHDENSHGADAFRYFAVASSMSERGDRKRTFKITDLEVA
jgi:phage terminase large subunit